MSKIGALNGSDEVKRATVMLTCGVGGIGNNFEEFKDDQDDVQGENFGFLANFITTNVRYVIPETVPSDYLPGTVAHGLSEDAVATLRTAAEKRRGDAIADQKKLNPKLFSSIYRSISTASRLLLDQDDDFADSKLRKDPFELWVIIVSSHLTNVGSGGIAAMNDLDVDAKQQESDEYCQTAGMPLTVYRKGFDGHVKILAALKVPVISAKQQAIQFIRKLDTVRYGGMQLALFQNAVGNIPFPATVSAAYTYAAAYKIAVPRVDASGTKSVVLIACDLYVPTVAPVPPVVSKPTNAAKSAEKTARKEAAARVLLTKSAPKAKEESSKSGIKGNPPRNKAQSAWVDPAAGRECYYCLEPGHLMADCPHNAFRAKHKAKAAERAARKALLVAIGEEDDEDDDIVLMVQSANSDLSTGDCVLFSDTEVIFDNAAGRPIFKSRDLLSDLTPLRRPFSMRGVDGTAKGLHVAEEGSFLDFGVVSYAPGTAGNILSQAVLVDMGFGVEYCPRPLDKYVVTTLSGRAYHFTRKKMQEGYSGRPYYTCEFGTDVALVNTVAANKLSYTKREISDADVATEMQRKLGHATFSDAIEIVNSGVLNSKTTATHLRNAEHLYGPSAASLMGKTKKRASIAAPSIEQRSRAQRDPQVMGLDIMFIKELPFLVGVLTPLGYAQCHYLKDRGALAVAKAIRHFLGVCASRNYDTVTIRTDGEGAVGVMVLELNTMGIVVDTAGPGQHVPQTVKQRFRCFEHSLPFVMPRTMIVYCVHFCTRAVNLVPSRATLERVSPQEQFLSRKLDAALDLRVEFGAFCHATVPTTDNSMRGRTHACIALGPAGNSTGTVRMWALATNQIVRRDQFTILPMPVEVVDYITLRAQQEGYSRGPDPLLTQPVATGYDPSLPDPSLSVSSTTLEPGVNDEEIGGDVASPEVVVPAGAVVSPVTVETVELDDDEVEEEEVFSVRRSARDFTLPKHLSQFVLVSYSEADASRAALRRQLVRRSKWHNKNYAFTMSVNAAIRERGDDAIPVIMAELQQMVDKGVWHGVHTRDLSPEQRRAIIRSSMFLKDKYFASGAFEKFKARLVAGGDQQDKGLYENLSSPTAATSSVMSVAAIAAFEGRYVIVIDIGGAYLNAEMRFTDILVHMSLNRVMTTMLLQIDPSYSEFVRADGTMVVALDKALYGCVEAAALWYHNLRSNLEADGFVANPYDQCIFNKTGADGHQITIALHVDDLMVTSVSLCSLEDFDSFLRSVYADTKTNRGLVLNYIGMTFDFSVPGEVSVTMDNCIDDILSECGVSTARSTPASTTLFDVRDACKATTTEAKWFHSFVAKILYVAKRVRPECLTAVAFLSTRVHACDIDDLAKLRRLLGYILGTRDRGITLRVGAHMSVRAYIDAAYGVHTESGKSHTGCVIVLGDAGPLYAKSGKQKIVTKSSTEAELVGLSDTASQAIHLRNFVIAQGYEVGPVVIYQDNLSCMALMQRGGPTSERSRHINIRHFWLAERVANKEVIIEHLGTAKMFANVLTKPVQGAQFAMERQGLTNWSV